jgi:hypothetical protein
MLPREEKEIQQEVRMSIDRIIDLVRGVRDSLISDFLEEGNVRSYFLEQFGKELSKVKAEFLKRDLKELQSSPIDLSHYGSLIKQIQKLNSASLATTHKDLFYKELERIFKKYNY